MDKTQPQYVKNGAQLVAEESIEKTLDSYTKKRRNDHKAMVKTFKSMSSSSFITPYNWEKRCEALENCGTFLQFAIDPMTDTKSLYRANFCRERLCPICARNRSMYAYHVLSGVTEGLRSKYKGLRLVFITLTVPNCRGEDLYACMKLLSESLAKLRRRKQFQAISKYGGYRKLEVTFNRKNWTFNAHLHLLVYTDDSYFTGPYYMKTEDLVKLWSNCVESTRRAYENYTKEQEISSQIESWQKELISMEVKQMDPDAGSGWTYWMTEKLSEQKILLPSNYSTLLEKRRDSRMLLNSIRQGYFKNLDTKSLVCHIEAVKENKIKNATAELSKYMSKPLTKMAKELEEAEYCVYWIDQAFHRQRTTAFWGEAWEVQKDRKSVV